MDFDLRFNGSTTMLNLPGKEDEAQENLQTHTTQIDERMNK